MDATNIGTIILAAGASNRLGEPKQLVEFNGKTLIERTIETAIQSKCKKISVVLGANSELIKSKTKDFPVQFCLNQNWQSGMASSLQTGLTNLLNDHPKINAVLILLCDQPLIESKHINSMLQTFYKTQKLIITAKYNKTVGVPAIFSKDLFNELMKTKGDNGARKILNKFPDLIEAVEIPEADFDIDSKSDLEKLRKISQ